MAYAWKLYKLCCFYLPVAWKVESFLAFYYLLATPPLWRDLVKIFDHKAVTYLIFFVGTYWFQKCNFWKNSLSPFWGRRGRWGQTTSKLKITKILNETPLRIDEIQNLASAISWKWPQRPRGSQKGLSEFFQKIHFLNQGKALRKMSYSSAFWSNFENCLLYTSPSPRD